MNLYRVYNGYMGCASVRCLVVAANEKRAEEIGRGEYKKATDKNGDDPHYYENIEVELIFQDCSKEQVSKITDE